jgi:anaphase-promoting complex subunit 8
MDITQTKINFSSLIMGENIQNNNNFDSSIRYENKYIKNLNNIKKDEIKIKDILSYASTLFDLKEYMKCNNLLRGYAVPENPTAMFLFYYTEYLMIQQRKQEEMLENSELGLKYCSSKEIYKLYQILKNYEMKNQLNSAFVMYLYAVVLKEINLLNEAHNMLIKCLNIFPFLWSAWVELALISKQDDLYVINIYIENNI